MIGDLDPCVGTIARWTNHPDLDGATRGRELDGVVQEVDHDLGEARHVPARRQFRSSRRFDGYRDAGLCRKRRQSVDCTPNQRIERDLGPIEAMVFNIGANVPCSILEETARKYFKIWEMACFAGFLTSQAVAKRMVAFDEAIDPGLAEWARTYLNETLTDGAITERAVRRRLEEPDLDARERSFLGAIAPVFHELFEAGADRLAGLRRAAATRRDRDLVVCGNVDRADHRFSRLRNDDAERFDLVDAGVGRVERARQAIEPDLAVDPCLEDLGVNGKGRPGKDDQIGVDPMLAGEPAAGLHAHGLDAAAADGGVGPGEVDELEEAALRLRLGEVLRAQPVGVDDDELARLDLAWSRDQAAKVYVQDRMRENAAELWVWISGGAGFYVCGDAERMAKDVEAELVAVVKRESGRSEESALEYVKSLKDSKRYRKDVY